MSVQGLRIPLVILVVGILAALFGLDRSGHATTRNGALAPLPDQLDTLLEQALASNPEILVKDAELREAIADLHRTRLAVTQQVVRLHFQRIEERAVVAASRRSLAMARQLTRNGSMSEGELDEASIALAQAEGAYARVEADLRYATGAEGEGSPRALDLAHLLRGGPTRHHAEEEIEEGTIPTREIDAAMKESLGQELTVNFDKEPLVEVLSTVSQLTGTNIIVTEDVAENESVVSLDFRGPVTLRQLLYALADTNPVIFIFREYGILVRYEDEHPEDGSPTIPAPH